MYFMYVLQLIQVYIGIRYSGIKDDYYGPSIYDFLSLIGTSL